MKSLEDAEAAGDTIRSIIVNTGINQDGHTRGIAMPNGEAQEALIRQVYKEARIDPSLVGYIEAHGTGTKVGDPLEARALNAVFGKGRTPRQPLFIGSVKSNIGHLEGSSGVVAVIKTVLALERGFVPPNCNFDKPNEEIPMTEWNMKVRTSDRMSAHMIRLMRTEQVAKKVTPWPRGKPYASVNNFGFGGTNAHVILERVDRHEGEGLVHDDPLKRKLFVASANDKHAALQMGKDLGSYVDQHPTVFDDRLFDKIAYTLGQRRSFFPWRMAASAELSQDLTALLSTNAEPVRCSKEPTVGFVFTGQGAQWHGMGRELLGTYPIFQQTMKNVDACLKSLGATFSITGKSRASSQLCCGVMMLTIPR